MSIQAAWRLMRPRHWIKNIIILLPLIFTGHFFDYSLWRIGLGFLAFSAAASGIYVLNDLWDIEADRQHPKKKNRPLVSGALSKEVGIVLMLGLFVVALGIHLFLDNALMALAFIILYVVCNLVYSLGGKHIPILDVSLLASGYVWRLLYGGALMAIPVSGWLFLTVLSLSFYLGIGKRYGELRRYGAGHRPVLEKYDLDFLQDAMQLFFGIGTVFYALWAFGGTGDGASLAGDKLLWTVPLVMILGLRYNYLIAQGSDGDPVNVLLGDRTLVVLSLLTFGVILGIIYL